MKSYQIIECGAPLMRRDYPTPEPRGTEVLLKVVACGVCHSDLHLWDGYFDLGDGQRAELSGRSFTPPLTLGHEVVGIVAAVGPEARGVEVGDARVVYPWIGCGECAACVRGDEIACARPRCIGINCDGGFSDHVLTPHPRYLFDFSGIPAEVACTYACSGVTAYSALKKIEATAGDGVVVIGAGGVGLNAIHIAPSVIGGNVIAADIDSSKRSAAEAAGAIAVIDNAAPDAVKKLRELTSGGAAAAIDFVGSPESVQFGLSALRKGGTLVVVGLFGGKLPLSTALIPLQMYRILGSYVGTVAEFSELIDLAKGGKITPLQVTSRRLAEANAVLDDLRTGKIIGRVVLKP